MGFIVTPPANCPDCNQTGRGQIHEQIHFLESAVSSFQAPESFVIKSEKIFDFFQFFFLNVGVDVIEIKMLCFRRLILLDFNKYCRICFDYTTPICQIYSQ